MIQIKRGETADTRTCDYAEVSEELLRNSSFLHIGDVQKALSFFKDYLTDAGVFHDLDKITEIEKFHADFITGFEQTGWWDNHRKTTRHHLNSVDGVPEDVNLIDVLEMISDCVMAGMARKGEVYPLDIKPEVLQKAFDNTVILLKQEVVVK